MLILMLSLHGGSLEIRYYYKTKRTQIIPIFGNVFIRIICKTLNLNETNDIIVLDHSTTLIKTF